MSTISVSKAGKNGFRVVNEFHGFDQFTTSEQRVNRLFGASRPRDCKSRTYIYRVENGVSVCRVDFHNGRLCDL